MAVTRLSGGITPGNGSDPRTFPAIWNATAEQIEQAQTDIDALESSVGTAQADIDALESSVGTAQADIIALQGTAVYLDSQIGTAQADISVLQSDLDALEAVAVTLAAGTPVNGNTIVYSTTSNGWIPAAGGGGGGGIDESYPITTVFLLGM